jgi:hypothetical protein
MQNGTSGGGRRGLGVLAAVVAGIAVLGAGASCYIGGGTAGPASGCTCDVTYGCDGCACEPVSECMSGPCYCDPTYGCDGCACEPASECIQGGSCICDQTYGCDGCACEPVGECV